MLFLRALPFSFAILWRFILILPFLLIFFVFYLILSVIAGVFFGFISIVLTIIILLATNFVMTMIPIIVGVRLGLRARREKVESTFSGVLLAALGYGALEAMLRLILVFFGFLAFVALSEEVSLRNVSHAFGQFSQAEADIAAADFTLVSVIGITLIIAAALIRAALLPAFAGAAAGLDPSGKKHTPFNGIGTSFVAMLFVVVLGYILAFMMFPAMFFASGSFGVREMVLARLADLEAVFEGGTGYQFSFIDLGIVVALFLPSLWLICFQSAGSALTYAQRLVVQEAQAAEEPAGQRMDPDELRDLLRSRMPKSKY